MRPTVPAPAETRHMPVPHPGHGEVTHAPSYRDRKNGDVIPKGEPITFALAGNQNCGKTTLFNQLTGSNQHVGNFPRRDGGPQRRPDSAAMPKPTVTDLPGIYSLSPYSNEEIVTRDFLLKEKPTGIINIVDATNIERNLYLTIQLMELQIPMVLALNMMDEVRANGGTIIVNELEALLGIPVVPISAARNEGIDELIEHAIHVARHREVPGRIDFCEAGEDNDPRGRGAPLHPCHRPPDRGPRPPHRASAPVCRHQAGGGRRADSGKAAAGPEREGDAGTHHRGDGARDRHRPGGGLADMRFRFIESVCAQTVVRPVESREHKRSVAIDRILTGRYTAIPCFLLILALVFWLTFGLIGAALSDLMSLGIDAVTNLVDTGLTIYGINPVVHSLVIDGIFAGVGTVLEFLPTIVTLFFFLSILEDTGYMARVAFVMDKPLRRIGLSGRSFVPMLIGFGCSVPAIMATRTLSSDRDRRMTVLLTPFMSCSAKLPIYALFTAAFFPRLWQPVVMVALYLMGVLFAVVYALILRGTRFRRGAGALRHGTAQLPSAQPQERGPADLGQGQGLYPARLHHHLCGHRHHLVPADL